MMGILIIGWGIASFFLQIEEDPTCTIEFGNGSPKRVSCFPDAQNTLNVDLLRKYTSETTPLGFENTW